MSLLWDPERWGRPVLQELWHVPAPVPELERSGRSERAEMRTRLLSTVTPWVRAIPLAGLLAAAPLTIRAQPSPPMAPPMMGGGMPDLRAISGRPLPDTGMPAGMITVRVARKLPANGVADAEVTAIIEAPGGESRKRTAKTDASGRATFESVPAGHRFRAEVVVDREKLATETFTVPSSGGVRTMLIGGLGPAGGAPGGEGEAAGGAPQGEGQAGRKPFSLGITSGIARLDPSLPAGVIEVHALDEQGRPLANQAIEVGRVAGSAGVQVFDAVTDAGGMARVTNLLAVPERAAGGTAGKTGEAAAPTAEAGEPGTRTIAAAVVMDRGGQRVSTDGFQLPDSAGIRVELRVPQVTADPSIVTIGEGGRIILQLREEGLSFIETFPLENNTDKVFDPGPGGIEIPLPKEAVGAEGAEGAHRIEIRKGIGVAVHGAIAPRRPRDPNGKSPDEVTFGFFLPARGSSLDFEQKFPNGIAEFTFATEQVQGLVIESPQITGRQDREFGGKKYWLMRGEPVPPGGTLRFTVHGLPATDPTGRIVSGVLALGLIAATIVLGRRPRGPAGASKEPGARDKLVQRREKLFAELMLTEEKRLGLPAAGAATTPAGTAAAVKGERDELVRKLESVYRELAALDDQPAT